jgi:uncharacterized membrane protein (DUF4010 family)
LEVFEHLGLALAVGLLVGLERGWQERGAAEGSRVAGIRTFALIGFGGGLAAALTETVAGVGFGLIFAAFAAVMIAAHVGDVRQSSNVGATTIVAALVTFLLGAVAVAGDMVVAAAGAVVSTILLSVKPVLHRWLERIERVELLAILKLLLISVVLLPVLPNRTVDPWLALNPYELWWMVVLIAGLSFCGYVAVRVIGPERGLMLTGLLGGLTSSTAVTLNFARLSRDNVGADRLLAASASIACGTMLPRILLVIGVLNSPLLMRLIVPMGAAALVTYIGAALLWRRPTQGASPVDARIENPFEFWLALRFGLLLAAIMLLARLVPTWLGEQGLFLLAAVSGLGDVDAISLSMAQVGGSSVSLEGAATAVAITALANSLVKVGLAVVVGRGSMAWRLAAVLGAAALVGAGLFLGRFWLPASL